MLNSQQDLINKRLKWRFNTKAHSFSTTYYSQCKPPTKSELSITRPGKAENMASVNPTSNDKGSESMWRINIHDQS